MDIFHPVNYVLLVAAGCAVAFLLAETIRFQLHQVRMRAIPVRIQVNGSRGKSSVTRLVGAVLRQTGKVTITKTTGTAPRFILPDGTEIPIFRPGKPNIIEQLKVVARARKLNAHYLIAECMAVTPEYIGILQDKVVQSTVGVMTNVREDHLDVMGPTVYDCAVNMSKSFPRNGIAFTAEKKWFSVLDTECKKRGTKLIGVSGDTVTDAEMDGFPYIEHKDNVAAALAIGEQYGVSRERALAAMYKAQPDPGVLREMVVNGEEGTAYFFNALAANDPDSSLLIWQMALARRQGTSVIVLILRLDRQQRTEGFAHALGTSIIADRYIIAGSPVNAVTSALRKKGVPEECIVGLENPTGHEVSSVLMSIASQGPVVACAMGNIIGLGDAFIKEIAQLSEGASA